MGQWANDRVHQQLHERFRGEHEAHLYRLPDELLVDLFLLLVKASVVEAGRREFDAIPGCGRFPARRSWSGGRRVLGHRRQRFIGVSNVVKEFRDNGHWGGGKREMIIIWITVYHVHSLAVRVVRRALELMGGGWGGFLCVLPPTAIKWTRKMNSIALGERINKT